MSKFKIGDEVVYSEGNVKMRGRIIKQMSWNSYMVYFEEEGCAFACAESELMAALDWV